jgi:hypothetical protein
MIKNKRVKIEFYHIEFEALKANSMISGTCGKYLASAEKHGDYIVLDLSIHEANDLVGWVAGEANHAESEEESDLLHSACDATEVQI